jgi:glucuronate isomerase
VDRRGQHFGDPTSLLISPDHYVTRLLHAHGVALERLGAGGMPLTAASSLALVGRVRDAAVLNGELASRYFVAHGAVSADHSHADAGTAPLDQAEAERIFAAARAGTATTDEATALRRDLLLEMARMSVVDGLVITLYLGVYRHHHTPTFERFGADVGCDIPVAMKFTRGLQPLLERCGTAAGFHLVLFTVR